VSTTFSKLAEGGASIAWVAAIEGIDRLLCSHSTSEAITAWAGTDWTTAIGGLFVDMENRQRIDPYDPFTTGGTCQLSVVDTDGSDEFGILVFKRSAGASTELAQTCDANDGSITVSSNANFPVAPDELHIGTECLGYSGKGSTTGFTGLTRGKYSPFPAGTLGATRFGQHHRVSRDKNQVLLNPTVSETPRIWLGRRVGIWMHTVAEDGSLNSKDDAQLVYAGVIVSVADDANTHCTRLELKHILDVVQDATVGAGLFSAEVAEGLYLQTGRKFTILDHKNTTTRTGDELEVVASGATGTNQINAGRYSADEICAAFGAWLGGEVAAARIWGYYSFNVTNNGDGLRTRVGWQIVDAANVFCRWVITMPGEVLAFLGFGAVEASPLGQQLSIWASGTTSKVPAPVYTGEFAPFRSLVFKPIGPGSAQEFSEGLVYDIENISGDFVDQYDFLPAAVKVASTTGHSWGIFLLDEKQLIVASYATNQVTNAWIAPWTAPGKEDDKAMPYIGRRLDEADSGPVKIRQVFVLTGTLQNILNRLFYGTGATDYNHTSYDTLGHGLGIGIPGSLLGESFERSIANMPGAQAELAVIFDESTTIPDLIGSDLLLRRASLRWYDEHLEFIQWQTPSGSLSAAELSDENKAAPATSDENHRAPTLETTVFQRALVKIDYNRDFSVGRNGDYRKSIQLEDQTAVDDSGGETRPLTIKARNTFSDFSGTGGAIEELTKSYLATMPMFSRAARHIRRSIDMRYFETLGVGDIVTVIDSFARDPATGLRGINSRYGTVISLSYNPGGFSPGADDTVRPMTGEVEIRIPDVNRYLPYGPSARVDDTYSPGAYSAGYSAVALTFRCVANQYSEATEGVDVSHLAAGDVVLIKELDPDDPAVVTYWMRTLASVGVGDPNNVTITVALSAPAWDSTKKYAICYADYGDVDANTTQRDFSYQSDDADGMVEDIEVPYHFSATNETIDVTANTGTEKAEFHSDISYGDGVSYDVAQETSAIILLNQLHDRRTAHQHPWLMQTWTGYWADDVTWQAVMCGPVYFGMDHLGSGVTRSLTVAPYLRVRTGTIYGDTGSLRITLSRTMPTQGPSRWPLSAVSSFTGSRFGAHWKRTATWTVTSTTGYVGDEETLSIDVKDLYRGYAWLTIETLGRAETLGLSKMIEGVRTVI
jgi:hypothetical protein